MGIPQEIDRLPAGRTPLEFIERLEAGGLGFVFHLCYKPVQLGEVHAGQFWMDTRTIYGQRQTLAINLQPMADYFWTRALLAGTNTDAAVQESYLLAHLAPHVRGTASQKVLVDARLRRPGNPAALKHREAEELEELLSKAQRQPREPDRQLTMLDFYRKTAGILGMPNLSESEVAAYREVSETLFADARNVLVDPDRSPGAACDVALAAWRSLTTKVGRRSGPNVAARKTAMNLLSYEARAAVHRCYSAVWNDLIPQLLVHRLNPPPLTADYLQLIHTERLSASTSEDANFHLFHGHLFALHPGMSTLMRTPTGQRMVGAYLEARTAEERVGPLQQLLMGIFTSLYHYAGTRDERRRSGHSRNLDKDKFDGLAEPP